MTRGIDLHIGQTVAIARVDGSDPEVPLPCYETVGAAGLDVRANLAPANRRDGIALGPGERALVPTGFSLAVPDGFEMQVRPRSGLALRHGISLVNAPGTIDSDYRGEVGVILLNTGAEPFVVAHGQRIGQLVLAPVLRVAWQEVDDLPQTPRGRGGFGSTGR